MRQVQIDRDEIEELSSLIFDNDDDEDDDEDDNDKNKIITLVHSQHEMCDFQELIQTYEM